ncbi:MAG: S-layer homology domain-containing protein [Candidatus Margulisbacteria bacterium]|nr:S-layer homology domain-containing protein [Candidatus Margulisiibacteriota bacterium]MBU1617766.1 S-layer homology domain-containing protein [Candidatus Margulisiibacteriota bacterium]
MFKLIINLLLLFVLTGAALGQTDEVKIKDLPADHWAYSAVYDLIRLGVTKGFPDGTYRGDQPITRYETALFLSKIADSLEGKDFEKKLGDLRDQIVELKRRPKSNDEMEVAGQYASRWEAGNVLATKGAKPGTLGNYRLMVTASREFSEGAGIKINLDTMDYGFYDDGTGAAGRGKLVPELMDVESRIKLEPVEVKVILGPGPKRHIADPTGSVPSDIGVTYLRPDSGVLAITQLYGAEIKGGFYSRPQGDFSGKVNSSLLTGSVGFNLNVVKLELTGDYLSSGSFSVADRTARAKVAVTAPFGEKVTASGTVGFGTEKKRMMVAGSVSLNDPWDTGTVFTVQAAKIGAEYISPAFVEDRFDFAGYDNFNRPLENGTVNFGGKLVQLVAENARLFGRGDIRVGSDLKYTGDLARFTAEGGIIYSLSPNIDLDAAYRVHQDMQLGDASDLAAVGLMYRF